MLSRAPLSPQSTRTAAAGGCEVFSLSFPARIRVPDREERSGTLNLKLSTTQDSFGRSEVLIELTEASDWLFFFVTRLNEADFHVLKNEQRLLVEYQHFAEMLRRLCSLERGLVAVFSGDGEGSLSFMESSEFRELVHFSLRMRRATDAQLKQHLAASLGAFSTQTRALETALDEQQHETRRWQTQFTHLSGVLTETEKQVQTQLTQAGLTHDNALLALQAKQSAELAKVTEQFTQRLAEQEAQSQKVRKTLELQVHEQQLAKSSLEASVATLTKELARSEAAVAAAGESVEGLKKTSDEFKLKHHRAATTLAETQTELNKTTIELKAAIEANKSQEKMREQAQVLADQLRDQKNLLERSNSQLNDQTTDLHAQLEKANDRVNKLEKDKTMGDAQLKTLKSKNKLKVAALLQQEQVVNELEKKMRELQQTNASLVSDLQSEQENTRKANQEAADTLRKLQDSQSLVASNEQLINYLNKQMNERDLHLATRGVSGHFTTVAGSGAGGSGGVSPGLTSRLKSLSGVSSTPFAPYGGQGPEPHPLPLLKTAISTTPSFSAVPDFPLRSATGEFAGLASPRQPPIDAPSPAFGSKLTPVRFTPRVREQ